MMENKSLLKYELSSEVTAFSTTRLSPFNLSGDEINQMGAYAAFNVTHYCGDDKGRVERNRAWLCGELGVPAQNLWVPRQTHTSNVRCIDKAFLSLTRQEQTDLLQEIDALITDEPRQCIGISTADCVPVLIHDKVHQAVAAIHAGWRGTVKRISQNALSMMHEKYGTIASDCVAVVGPSISQQAFEVGNEVRIAFEDAGFPTSIIDSTTWTKPHIDLWAANVYLLEEAGVKLSNIQIANVCTYVHSDVFFSARKLGINSGRIYSAIFLN